MSDVYSEMVPRIEDDYLNVMTENGRYVEGIIDRPSGHTRKALEEGALAAGITGTGPATAIIAKKGDGQRIAGSIDCRKILATTRC